MKIINIMPKPMSRPFQVFTALCVFTSLLCHKPVYGAEAAELQLLTEARFDAMGSLSEDLIWCKSGSSYQYIDTSGRTVIGPFGYSKYFTSDSAGALGEVGNFHEGRAYIRDSEASEQVYINKSGVKIFDLSQDNRHYGYHFSEGSALAFNNDDTDIFVYNANGRSHKGSVEIDGAASVGYGPHFLEGMLNIFVYGTDDDSAQGRYRSGYVNTDFQVVIDPVYEDTRPFNNGRAFVKSGGLWGVIDARQNKIIQPSFEDFLVTDADYSYQIFHDGIATVKKEGLWGFVDKAGAIVTECIYDQAGPFSMGYAAVTLLGKTGYINAAGEIVVEPKFLSASPVFQDFSVVSLSQGSYQLLHLPTETLMDTAWAFDSLLVYNDHPNYVLYQQNNKWGLAAMNIKESIPINNTTETAESAVYFRGKPLHLTEPVINRQDRSFYPFRNLLEAIGAEVSSDPLLGGAKAELNENIVIIFVASESYIANGITYEMEPGAAPFIENDWTYAPIRVICENLGFEVSWDEATGAIHID